MVHRAHSLPGGNSSVSKRRSFRSLAGQLEQSGQRFCGTKYFRRSVRNFHRHALRSNGRTAPKDWRTEHSGTQSSLPLPKRISSGRRSADGDGGGGFQSAFQRRGLVGTRRTLHLPFSLSAHGRIPSLADIFCMSSTPSSKHRCKFAREIPNLLSSASLTDASWSSRRMLTSPSSLTSSSSMSCRFM